jgi:hypothetical protein
MNTKNELIFCFSRPAHRSNTSYVCHNCKQPGHIRNQCPQILVGSTVGMDSSHMIILDYQRRSLFSVILSSSIPFCISDYFITYNKDAVRHNNTKDVNHISSYPFPSDVESSLNKNKNNNKDSPFFSWSIFSLLVRSYISIFSSHH